MKSSVIRSVLAVLLISATAHAQCPGDVNNNGVVNGTDLAAVLSAWGTNGQGEGGADLNDDGIVNGQDLAAVLGGWGPCRPIITSISPNQGHVDGGALITIFGHYLAGTTSVTIGGAPATPLTEVSANTVRVVAPPGLLGPKDVSLTTSAGVVSVAAGFTYVNIVVPTWATLIQVEPDPAVVVDPVLRAAILATGYAWRVRDTATQIEMLLVPPGSYMRGCSPGDSNCQSWELPRHQVTLTQPFYMGRYEVTQTQWLATTGFNPSQFQQFPDSPLLPVERVSRAMIDQSFLAVTGLRLPTDAEWEYACRAGTTTAYFNGSNDMHSVGSIMWNLGNSGNRPRPVGTKAANALGLHDMLGNIWEWCSDIYSGYGSEPLVDPTGPTGPPTADRVLRGGSFGDLWFVAYRSSYRAGYPYIQQEGGVGFRVARNP